jgi:hypothetical protein
VRSGSEVSRLGTEPRETPSALLDEHDSAAASKRLGDVAAIRDAELEGAAATAADRTQTPHGHVPYDLPRCTNDDHDPHADAHGEAVLHASTRREENECVVISRLGPSGNPGRDRHGAGGAWAQREASRAEGEPSRR